MGFLQQFHLIIKYKKGSTNKLEYILSRITIDKITTLGTHMHIEPFTHDAYKEEYIEYEDFKEVFQQIQVQFHVEEGDNKVDYHLHDGLLYKLDKLHILKGERLQLIIEEHTTEVARNFFTCREDSCKLTMVCYYPRMK